MLIDTHAHLDDEQYDKDREEVIKRAENEGLEAIINMSVDLSTAHKAVKLAEEHKIIYAAVGAHPEDIEKHSEKDEDAFAQLIEDNEKVVGVGEIGLDYHFTKDNKELQQEIFIKQLDLARQMAVPVSIHARDAYGDLLAILKKEGRGIRGVIHCYSGSEEIAKELLKMGWYIGVDGPLTFKNAAKLPELIKTIPLERLLLETDCPYMAPVPKRGKRNEPSYVQYVGQKVAQLRNMEFAEIAAITTANAKALFFNI